jgi:hypothetical protein
VSNSQRSRKADLVAGQRRIRAVTGWSAAGAVLVGALAAGMLASGTSAAASTTSSSDTGSQANSSDSAGTSNSDQLQAPDYAPGSDSGYGYGRHAGSGGS